MTQICSHSEKCNTLILLSCAQVGVQSEPFCFHAGTTLKDGQIISYFYVYTTMCLRLTLDRLFISQLILVELTHRLA